MGNTVTSKGQVTIPKKVRDRLGITSGSEVEFSLNEQGEVVLLKRGRKSPVKQNPFDKIRGTLKTDMTTDQIMALLRGDD
jgi:AbrB family looped-hinge helix DNA binding protein